MINRKQTVMLHNPKLEEVNINSPLTVGNGEIAFTADITGLQTLYDEYTVLPLCTQSQWGWHTIPVSEERYQYTLDDLVMTTYTMKDGKVVKYPKKKMEGNEEVYDWLRQNPHRLNLSRVRFFLDGKTINSEMIHAAKQELDLYTGILHSRFYLENELVEVETACHGYGKDAFGFKIKSGLLQNKRLTVVIDFAYGSPKISASDWDVRERHTTTVLNQRDDYIELKRQLDKDIYYCTVQTNAAVEKKLGIHEIDLSTASDSLHFIISYGKEYKKETLNGVDEIFESSVNYWKNFWNEGAFIKLNESKDKRALELERRIIVSQYLMAVNSSGSNPPQETGLTCNSWYGKMHLEMYLWHCAWLSLWGHGDMLERSLLWYKNHIEEARINARRNDYKGARWPKMIASEGIDCPSPVAPLLIWQQPHIIYMLEYLYREKKDKTLLTKYWELISETADFMVDFVVWNEEKKSYDLPSPVIPVQECHKEVDTINPAFELEYWIVTLNIAIEWAKRLDKPVDDMWVKVAQNMTTMSVADDCYLAHTNCIDTFEKYNRDHPSMLGSFGLIGSQRIDTKIMRNTLHRVIKEWNYQSLWGWDFALMAMTAVRLKEPEQCIELLLMKTEKNCYVESGNNMQILRNDLPLYLPGNGSLLLAVAMMAAGYDGCNDELPGFPHDGNWKVEFENMNKFM